MQAKETITRLVLFGAAAAIGFGQGTITVYSSGSVTIGSTRQLSAYVPLSPNTVVWSVNGVNGGNATHGTVSSNGLYSAPASAPADNVVTVRATSTAYPNISGAVSITIVQPTPWVWNVNPSSFPAGQVTITIGGSNLRPDSIVKVNGVTFAPTFVSSTSMKAAGLATGSGKVPVTVTNPGNGAVTSQPFMATVTAPASPPPPAISLVSPGSIQQGSFSLSVNGSGFVQGSLVLFGGAALTTTYISSSQLTAAGSTNAAVGTSIPVTVSNPAPNAAVSGPVNVTIGAAPAPNMSMIKAGRFLEQAAFGPNTASMNKVLQGGIDAWLDEQFAMPETVISIPSGVSQAKGEYLNRLAHAPDQLRQKAAWALNHILVISANKNIYPDEIVPLYQLLSKHAFGNYRTLLREVAQSSQMGKYLDLANSVKPSVMGGANENFPRELLQLFSIGLVMLNPDGSTKLDGGGKPVPAYTQNDIKQFSLALTGWTYPPANGKANWENFSGPMVPLPQFHDTTAKTLLNGVVLPAGQTVEQDMDGAIDNVFNHPNTGPFLATRLVRAMVSSNASPAYIQRVANAFNNDGAGVRGDLKAVFRAILTDPEARQDTAAVTQGRLKDAIYQTVALVRALDGSVNANNQSTYLFTNFNQNILTPSSVFGFYSPMYKVPKSALFGPEFQIYSPTEAVLRGNLIAAILGGNNGDFPVSMAPYQAVAGNVNQLIDKVDQVLLYGRMPASMRNSLTTALNAQYDNNQRAFVALYLTALSGQYAVQY